MEVILDTNFIMTCLKEKIDFTDAEKFGRVVIPEQVIDELEKKSKEGKVKDRDNAKLALDIIKKKKLEIIKLERKFVDAGIKRYVSDSQDIIVATLDKELKKAVKGKAKILTIRARKKLMLV